MGQMKGWNCSHSLEPWARGILLYFYVPMPTDPPPSSRDRRHYFRMTTALPISIQLKSDTAKIELVEKSVNLSAGGIGFVTDTAYGPGDILTITLRLEEHVLFVAQAEVLRQDLLPSQAYRIHARFIRMSEHDRESLVGHIMRLQRAHLHGHYSA